MHTYDLMDKDSIVTADAATIAKLSQVKKYDILVGNYDFSFTHKIVRRTIKMRFLDRDLPWLVTCK